MLGLKSIRVSKESSRVFNSCYSGSVHRNGKVVMVTVLVFTGDVEACLQRLLWKSGLSSWRPFRFSGIYTKLMVGHQWGCRCPGTVRRLAVSNRNADYICRRVYFKVSLTIYDNVCFFYRSHHWNEKVVILTRFGIVTQTASNYLCNHMTT